MELSKVAEEIKKRLSNPTLSSFIVTASVYNWKVVLMIFTGSADFGTRISAIDQYLNELNRWDGCWMLIYWFLYLYVVPLFSEFLQIPIRAIAEWKTFLLAKHRNKLRDIEELGGSSLLIAQAARAQLVETTNVLRQVIDFSATKMQLRSQLMNPDIDANDLKVLNSRASNRATETETFIEDIKFIKAVDLSGAQHNIKKFKKTAEALKATL